MKTDIDEVKNLVETLGSTPKLEEMKKRTLYDKLISGPTAAHVIEEVHTPYNLAYLTFTTGSSAFQNIVGITYEELDGRITASKKIFERVGLKAGDTVVITYAPLVNVFCGQAFKEANISVKFLLRSSRDALIVAIAEYKPKAIVGESSFIRSTLEDMRRMGLGFRLPEDMIILAAGTALDLELLDVARAVNMNSVHDLYGCQEFGWLLLDGMPLRDDIDMIRLHDDSLYELVVGGLPTGDRFPVSDTGHVCNKKGKIITYRRERSYPEWEVIVCATTVSSLSTIERAARSILRIKGRIVKVSPEVKLSSEHTVLKLQESFGNNQSYEEYYIVGPKKTSYFDIMVEAQRHYQQTAKVDPTWIK